MYTVHIYIAVERGPKRRLRAGGYILELKMENRAPKTLTNVENTGMETEQAALLVELIESVQKLKKPCHLVIHTETQYLQGIEHIEEWRMTEWKTRHKKCRPYKYLWEKLNFCLREHKFEFKIAQPNEYQNWLKSEIKKKGDEIREKERQGETV